MASDFLARQIRTAKIIGSGTEGPVLVYSSSAATDTLGGYESNMISKVGSDVWLFVSGTQKSSPADRAEVVLFGGDVVVSGTMYMEKIVAQVSDVTKSDHYISGSLIIQNDHSGGGTYPSVISRNYLNVESTKDIAIALDDGTGGEGAIAFDYHADTKKADAMIWEGGGTLSISASSDINIQPGSQQKVAVVVNSPYPSTSKFTVFSGSTDAGNTLGIADPVGKDTNFYVSGALSGRQSVVHAGVGVFGGDLVTSGSSYTIGHAEIGYDSNNSTLKHKLRIWGHPVASWLDIIHEGYDYYLTTSGSSGRDIVVRPSANSAGSFQVQSASGGVPIFSVDTSNQRVGIGTLNPDYHLHIHGAGTHSSIKFSKESSGEAGSDGTIIGLNSEDNFLFLNKEPQKPFVFKANYESLNNEYFDELLRIGGNGVRKQVLVMSGGMATSTDEAAGLDVCFYVSGSRGSRGTAVSGSAVFGGDVVISGTLHGGSPLSVGSGLRVTGSIVATAGISGSLTHLHDGSSYLIAGSNVTITTGSSGAVTVAAATGGTMSTWTLAGDSGPGQEILNTNTVQIAGGSGIDTVASATDTLTVGIDNSVVATLTGSVFSGHVGITGSLHSTAEVSGSIIRSPVLTGSLTRLEDGSSYLIAGTGIEIASGSSGAVTVSSTVGSGQWTDGGNFLYPSDSSGDEHVVIGGNTLQSADILLERGGGAEFNKQQSNQSNFKVSTQHKQYALYVHGNKNQVLVHSGGASTSTDESAGLDVSFYISGSKGSRGTALSGSAVFGGDVAISGSLFVSASINPGASISGSIHHTEAGLSYLVAGSNVTITSASNGQVTIASANGTTELSDDTTPELGGQLVTGDHKIAFATGDNTSEIDFTYNGGGNFTAIASVKSIDMFLDSNGGDSGQKFRIFNNLQPTSAHAGGTNTDTNAIFMVQETGNVLAKGYVTASMGLSGSLTRLTDGRSYLVAGSNVTITSASNGQVTIASSGGGSSEWTDGGNFLRPSDISGAEHIVIGGTSLPTADILLGAAGGAEFNKQQQAGSDFTISTEHKSTAFRVDGGTNQVLILSGGHANSVDETKGSDVSFYVSGSIGSRGTVASGSAVFGGDVVVSGTLSVNRGQAGAGSVVTVTSDGKVGIGTDTPSYKLEVGGNMALGEYLYHRGDAHTYMRLEDDKISFSAGNQTLLTLTEATQDVVTIGDTGDDVDFQVIGSGDSNALFVQGSSNRVGIGTNTPGATLHVKDSAPSIQIQREANSNDSLVEWLGAAGVRANMVHLGGANDFLISTWNSNVSAVHESLRFTDDRAVIFLSGTGVDPAAMQPAVSTDISFFVSGSRTEIGGPTANTTGRQAGTRSNTVFGGDVVFSGTLHGASNISAGNPAIHMSAGTYQMSAQSQFAVCDNAGVAPGFGSSTALDVFFTVSGSKGTRGSPTNRGVAVFGGELVTSGALTISGSITDLHNPNAKIEFAKGATNSFAITTADDKQILTRDSAGTPDSIIINNDAAQLSFLVKTNSKMAIGCKAETSTTNTVYINTDTANEAGSDTALWISGSTSSRFGPARGVSVFGGDVVVSGSLRARQVHITTHRYSPGNNLATYLRFDDRGGEGAQDADNIFVTPYGGRLIKVVIRADEAAGNTTVGFHKNTDGNEDLNGSATETKTVNMTADDTSYSFVFTETSSWNTGDIVGLRVDPSSDPGNVNVTAVWEFETY